jgi:hypothetical protein
VYYDGINFARVSMHRVRKAANGQGGRSPFPPLLDLHTGRDSTRPPALGYASHYPFVDSIWNGEGFDFSGSPTYWLVEISSYIHGLTGDRLGGGTGPNDFRGMLFGMTERNSATAPALWALWDWLDLPSLAQVGFWSDVPLVGVALQGAAAASCGGNYHNASAVLTTTYTNFRDRALVVVASWCPVAASVLVRPDWAALGLEAAAARASLPAVAGVQAGVSAVDLSQPLSVAANAGLLLLLALPPA